MRTRLRALALCGLSGNPVWSKDMPVVTVSRVLVLIALVVFVLATFGVALGGLALVPLGLAFLAASHLVP